MNFKTRNDNKGCLIDYDPDVPTIWSARIDANGRRFLKTINSGGVKKEEKIKGTCGGSGKGVAPEPVRQERRPAPGNKKLTIGGNDAGYQFNGLIAELIYYNRAVSDAEMAAITDSLYNKWLTPLPPPTVGAYTYLDMGPGIFSSRGGGNCGFMRMHKKLITPEKCKAVCDVQPTCYGYNPMHEGNWCTIYFDLSAWKRGELKSHPTDLPALDTFVNMGKGGVGPDYLKNCWPIDQYGSKGAEGVFYQRSGRGTCYKKNIM